MIYHRADFDGLFCREIARKFLPDAELIGWDYGDPVPTPDVVSSEDDLYMLDISVEALMNHPQLVWIDHHKSAMEKFHHGIPGYRIDGVAACRLAWQYFSQPEKYRLGYERQTEGVEPAKDFERQALPTKEDYMDRRVTEPLAVRLAGEYDIWDKRDPDAELFQHGLRSQPLGGNLWRWMLGIDCDPSMMVSCVEVLLRKGECIQYAKTQENADIITNYGFTVQWEGSTFLCCNHARFNSHLFTAGIKPEHQALLGFKYDGKGSWMVSLYHAPGHEDIDLSTIAVKYGGGGHRGACGFRVKELPFLV